MSASFFDASVECVSKTITNFMGSLVSIDSVFENSDITGKEFVHKWQIFFVANIWRVVTRATWLAGRNASCDALSVMTHITWYDLTIWYVVTLHNVMRCSIPVLCEFWVYLLGWELSLCPKTQKERSLAGGMQFISALKVHKRDQFFIISH
jgi:hypothetical protein